jgi:ribose-phosphate pyrophosphokinase
MSSRLLSSAFIAVKFQSKKIVTKSFRSSHSKTIVKCASNYYSSSDESHLFKVVAALTILGLGSSTACMDSDEFAEPDEAAAKAKEQTTPVVEQSPQLLKPDTDFVKSWIRDTNKSPHGIKIFTGNSNKLLAKDIAEHLGMGLGKISVSHFADGEVNVMVNENVRGKDVYIIQPTSPPVNETLMELLLMISTMRRASARKITAVIPYYGYARQDRKMQARVPISAADVARLLESMGVDRVVAVDLHCGQIQGFFGPRVPVDNLDGGTVGVSYFGDMDLINPVIVSPDAGGVYRAKQFREALLKKHDVDCGLAMIVKQRAKANEIERMDLVGSVQDCDAIIVDDMVDTAGTLCKAAEMLKDSGARRVYAFASHGVFSGPAVNRIAASVLTELVVLDTIPLSPEAAATGKITQLSVGPLLAQAIYNIHNKKSISALFK